jgi:hypothetical protein
MPIASLTSPVPNGFTASSALAERRAWSAISTDPTPIVPVSTELDHARSTIRGMASKTTATKGATAAPKRPRSSAPSAARLDKLIEEATVDAYDESEQAVGFYTMIGGNLVVPFKTEMLGVEVTVERIELTKDDRLVAICARGKARQSVSVLDLPLPSPPPKDSSANSHQRCEISAPFTFREQRIRVNIACSYACLLAKDTLVYMT